MDRWKVLNYCFPMVALLLCDLKNVFYSWILWRWRKLMPRSNSFHQPPWPRTLVFCITWVNPPYLTISKEWWSLYEISSCDISSEKTLSLLWNEDRLNYIIWLFGIHIHVDNHPLTREMSKYFIYAFQFNECTST